MSNLKSNWKRAYSLDGIVSFLTRVKAQALSDKLSSIAGCGCMVVAHYVDECIETLLENQTRIAELENRLQYEQETNEEYRQRYGDIDDIEEEKENEP